MVALSRPQPMRRAPPDGHAAPLGAVLSLWLKLGFALALVGGVYAWRYTQAASDETFFWTQDLPVLGIVLLLAVALRFIPMPWASPLARAALRRPLAWSVGLAVLAFAVGLAGAPLLFGGYELSLDEYMADFDATIFGHGQLMAPVATPWRDYLPALQPLFGLTTGSNAVWASGYLPMNAAIRALADLIHAKALVNPLWSAVSVVAVYGVARRLWPERPGMALAAAALLGTSSQLLLMAMTAYAMPAHLALNLVWLWLFLLGGRTGHAGALAVAFVACGLHQVVFHPLFAAPFVLQLWLDRRWRLAAIYTAAYAAIGVFWVEYQPALLAAFGGAAGPTHALPGGWFAARVAPLLANVHTGALGAMAESLLRFATWQNPLTTPLALIAGVAAFRTKGHMRAMALGVVLTLLVMLLLMPSQSHGWGYRYLQGFMGSIALLAAWSWSRITDALPPQQRTAATSAFAAACVASLVVLLPVRAWQAWRYTAPYAAAAAAIQSAPAQVVIIDHDQPGLAFNFGAFVRNDPYLSHTPKVLLLAGLSEPALRQLCAHNSVLIFDGRSAADFGIDRLKPAADADGPYLRAVMARIGCGRRLG